jgi:coenzyme F420 biosynthesis associated uncharacterized protein
VIDPVRAHHAVAELRELAQLAQTPVAELTGLQADPQYSPAVVVNRAQWVTSNVAGFAYALEPLLATHVERSSAPIRAIGSRVAATQLGGALAWLSGKVLGQYEALRAPGAPGRLLLVAPNIVAVESELGLVPRDFRYWVCLHEETHRVQFGGVPWLTEHFLAEVRALVQASDLRLTDVVGMAAPAVGAVITAARGGGGPSLMEALQTREQRAIFDRLTGLMSLLEGHADYVMDEVGPGEVPTVAVIRERFDQRRSAAGTVDGFARRVLGLETKLRQYSAGSTFVRTVIGTHGSVAFAQVWAAPENLPTAAEIEDPTAWAGRVLGER